MKSLLCKLGTKDNILLAVIWAAVITTGFLALGAIVGGIEGLTVFGRLHSLAARLGLVYTAVHMYRLRRQIMSHLSAAIGRSKQAKKMRIEYQSPKSNRAVKVISALAFHIILHMISVHLAVAYTVFHIIQHRQDISSLFKKLSLNRNVNHSHPLPLAQLAA